MLNIIPLVKCPKGLWLCNAFWCLVKKSTVIHLINFLIFQTINFPFLMCDSFHKNKRTMFKFMPTRISLCIWLSLLSWQQSFSERMILLTTSFSSTKQKWRESIFPYCCQFRSHFIIETERVLEDYKSFQQNCKAVVGYNAFCLLLEQS